MDTNGVKYIFAFNDKKQAVLILFAPWRATLRYHSYTSFRNKSEEQGKKTRERNRKGEKKKGILWYVM